MPILPIPPPGTPYIDPRTGQVNLVWQNYYLSLQESINNDFAPKDARYWVSTPNANLTNETNLGALATGYLKITTAIGIATPSTVPTIPGGDVTGAALSRGNDTNVTLTLGGSPSTALLAAASITAGWTGTLAVSRGGTGASLAATGGTSQVLRQSTVGGAVTVSQLAVGDISGMGTTATAYGAGTAYALTDTPAALDFGTTDPAITITSPGTYLLLGQVLIAYNAATVVAETATFTLRRTNNTPADLGQTVVIDLPIATTLTYSYGIVTLPPVVYTNLASDDAITLFGSVSATLGAGTIDATAVGTSIVAMRMAA